MAVRIGDVVEIRTSRGWSYAQYTHKHAQYGALIRVFDGAFEQRPIDFREVVSRPIQFTTFFPLGATCARGIVVVVSNQSVQTPLEFPLFRTGVADESGKVRSWWLWDGKSEVPIGELSPGQENIPIRGVITDGLLFQRIESGWRHQDVT